MADQVLTKQKLINADEDLGDLEEVLNGPPGKLIKTRLGREVYTLSSVPQINTMTREEVAAAVAPKANKADVDTALSNLSTTANKYYPTLAAANADIANIALNQSVTVSEEANSGLWYKATVGATTLTKSPYDPVKQAEKYADSNFSYKVSQEKNLYNDSNNVTGKYVIATEESAGQISSSPGTILNVFPVEAGKTYNIESSSFASNLFSIALRTTNSTTDGATLSGLVALSDTEDDNVKSFTVPSDSTAKYAFMNVVIPGGAWDIRSGLIVADDTTITAIGGRELVDKKARASILNITSKNVYLDGKKWCVIGDSITEVNFRTNYNYHYYVAKSVENMTVYNYGISGSGFYNRSGVASTITQTDIDILTVFFGTNDWANVESNNKQLGTFLDTGTTTVSGCINTLLSDLIAKFPTKIIGVFTPLPRLTNWGSNAAANTQGYTLEQLSNLIIQYAKHYSLPYLDLYHESNLPVWNSDANAYYFTAPSLSAPDGLHPNDAGHKVIAGKVKAFLESIVAVS